MNIDQINISEIEITPIKPQNGLIAFASCVIDNKLYLSSIAIHTRLEGGFRLSYPTKKIGERSLDIYHPINRETGKAIETAIITQYNELLRQS